MAVGPCVRGSLNCSAISSSAVSLPIAAKFLPGSRRGSAEAERVLVLLEERPPLHAEVAARDRVRRVSSHGDGTAVLEIDLDPADGMAESAEALMRLDHRPPSRFLSSTLEARSPSTG
jgi:hypothetical protein